MIDVQRGNDPPRPEAAARRQGPAPLSDQRRQPARRVDQPEPGYFLVRLVKGGPRVAAEITHRRGLWGALVNGETCGAQHADWTRAAGVAAVWLGERIDAAEYRRVLALAAQPGHPNATPRRPLDLAALPPLF